MNPSARTSGGDVQAAFCAVLVDEWARAGLTEAVVAPGSRSTPLVIAFDADPRVRVHVVLDERSAGFTALGLALATRRPVVVGTTSGTASVELHPAVVEAFHASVPLIAATCDRPPELHDVGAPQTVDQQSLFGPAVRWSVSPGVPNLDASTSWRSLASRVYVEANGSGGPPGPVHLNLAFREPLIGDPSTVLVPEGRPGGEAWHVGFGAFDSRVSAPDELVDFLASYRGARGLVVAGWGAGDAAELAETCASLGWPLVVDPRSGARTGSGPVIAAADALLRVPAIATGWTPDVVVRAGATWASKVLSQWLASLPPSVPQVLADPLSAWADPERRSSHVVAVSASRLLAQVAALGGTDGEAGGEWFSRWVEAERTAQRVFDRLLGAEGQLSLSEPAVARAILRGAPDGSRIVVSSSMPIRDAEWFGPSKCDCEVLANRGTNGIDGVMSTAVGVALAGAPTVALLGDLAFLYDAGSLLWLDERDLSLTVVVVDNDGGGIFSFLPQASAFAPERFERYWGTPHGTDLVSIAAGYGIAATEVRSRGELDEMVAGAGKPGVRVGIVRSDRSENVAVHERLNAAVAEAVLGSG